MGTKCFVPSTSFFIHSILKQAAELEPCLAKADIVNTWTGFRPYRSSVMLRMENRTAKDGSKRCVIMVVVTQTSSSREFLSRNSHIIHNYGHGGSGMTIWKGCANDAIRLLQTAMLEQHGVKSRL